MTAEEKVKVAVRALDAKKAENIRVLKVNDLTILGDYFVIADGTSSTQTKALTDEVEFQLSQRGIEAHHREGGNSSDWFVLDYTDVIVHIFYQKTREFYRLEQLWAGAEAVDLDQFLEESSGNGEESN